MKRRVLLALPIRNEARILSRTVAALQDLFRRHSRDLEWHLVLSENGSTDRTGEAAEEIAKSNRDVTVVRARTAGKGMAIRAAWESREAEAYAFSDADLAANIELLPAMVRGILDGCDICIASRRLPGVRVNRPAFDRFTSLALNMFVRRLTQSRFADTACGLKAVHPRVVRQLVPQVRNLHWSFDTELLLLAERRGYDIREYPVSWREPRRSRMTRVLRATGISADYLRSLWRLRIAR